MNAFQIIETPEKGLALIASKSFDIGDTIFEEEPFISCQYSWNKAYGYAACDHCMRPLETITANVRRLTNDESMPVPLTQYDPTLQWTEQFTTCSHCKVQYCCEDCRREALKRYHRVECMGNYRNDDAHPINRLNDIWKKMHYPPETGTIMLITRLMAMYEQSNNKTEFLSSLQSFQSAVVNRQHDIYHKMLGANFEQQMQQLFDAFCLTFHEEKYALFTTPDAFKALMGLMGTNSQGIATSVLAEWIKRVEQVRLPDEEKAHLDQYIDELYAKAERFSGDFLNNEGSGLYILQSKINHSCMPNAQCTFPYSNDIVVVKAIRPIQANEEICISYLDECQLERSRHSRQKILKDNYIFLCQCPKCQQQANDPDDTSEEEAFDDDEDDEGDMDMDNDD